MATSARDVRASKMQQDDDERAADVKLAFDENVSSAAAKREPLALLQRMARLFQKFDADFKRPKRRAANALKQLSEVPLRAENTTWQFEQSLRLAFLDAVNENAEFDIPQNEREHKEWRQNHEVRAVFLAAIRIDADQKDVAHVMSAVKRFSKKSDDDNERISPPYLGSDKEEE